MLFGWVVTLRADVVDPALGLLVGKRAYASATKSVFTVSIAYQGRRCTKDGVNIMDAAMVATTVGIWNGCGGPRGENKAYLLSRPWSLQGVVWRRVALLLWLCESEAT